MCRHAEPGPHGSLRLRGDTALPKGCAIAHGERRGPGLVKIDKGASKRVAAHVWMHIHTTRSNGGDAGLNSCRRIVVQASAEEQHRRPLIKICGVTTEADATMAAEAGADFVGESLASAFAQHTLYIVHNRAYDCFFL